MSRVSASFDYVNNCAQVSTLANECETFWCITKTIKPNDNRSRSPGAGNSTVAVCERICPKAGRSVHVWHWASEWIIRRARPAHRANTLAQYCDIVTSSLHSSSSCTSCSSISRSDAPRSNRFSPGPVVFAAALFGRSRILHRPQPSAQERNTN